MSDNGSLSDIAASRQAGRIASPQNVTKRRRAIHHAQVIRADSTCLPTRRPTLRERGASAAAEAARERSRARRKPRNSRPFRRRRDPGLGAGGRKGRAGRSAVFRRRRARFARRVPCAPTRPPPARCAPAWRCRAPRLRPKSCALNADEAALRDLRFAVGDPLGPAGEPFDALARLRRPAAQPRPRPDRRRGGAARPALWSRAASRPA